MPPHDPNPSPSKPPLQVAKKLPPREPPPAPSKSSAGKSLPTAAKLPPAQKLSPKPKPPADPGFEVVDDDAGFEVVDDAPTKKTKRSAAVENDTEIDDRPRKRRGTEDDDDDEVDDRPKKKKRKRKRIELDPEELAKADKQANMMMEWGAPAFLCLIGIGMMVAGSLIASKGKADTAALSAVGSIMVTLIYSVISIPLTIVVLMVVGIVVGIEYGEVLPAIRNLTAITFLINGIYFLGGAFGLFGTVAAMCLAFVAGFALFMTLFRLDTFETWISLMALNVLAWVMNTIFFIVIIAIAVKASGGVDRDIDPDDNGPAIKMNQPNDPFKPGGGGNRRNRGGFDPDDDDN